MHSDYNKKFNSYSYAYTISDLEDNLVSEGVGSGSDPNYAQYKEVTGYIMAFIDAVKDAFKRGYKYLYIHTKYNGLEVWARSKAKSRIPMINWYKYFYKQCIDKGLNIIFEIPEPLKRGEVEVLPENMELAIENSELAMEEEIYRSEEDEEDDYQDG